MSLLFLNRSLSLKFQKDSYVLLDAVKALETATLQLVARGNNDHVKNCRVF